MNKIINSILEGLYIIGILAIFCILVVQFYDWFDGKNGDLYSLFLILVSFYSLGRMIYKLNK